MKIGSRSARFLVIRLLLSVASTMTLRLSSADVQGAYAQWRLISRGLYARALLETGRERGIIRKHDKLSYSICKAGRLWTLVSGHGF